jgi:hypothetical protein
MCGPQPVAAVRGIPSSIAATGASPTMVEADELLTGGGMAGAGDGESRLYGVMLCYGVERERERGLGMDHGGTNSKIPRDTGSH